MKFTGRKILVTGIVLGMILSFLLSQPTILKGFISLTSYFYSFLPTSLARFLRGQTFVALTFFWMLMLFGIIMWLIRGEFYRAEDNSRRNQFTIVNPNRDDEEKDRDSIDE